MSYSLLFPTISRRVMSVAFSLLKQDYV